MTKISKFIEFTPEQKERAATVNLEEFLLRQGEKFIKSGREKRLASDHSITVRGCEWFDHASNEGGRAVSFVQKYYGKSYIEAMAMLLGESMEPVYPQAKKQEVQTGSSSSLRKTEKSRSSWQQSVPMHFDSIFTDRVAEMEYAWLP